MLERLRLKNFQNHADLTIQLDPTVTCIVGPSDRGKTAILRALRWLVFNRPAGQAHIRHGEDLCSVTLKVDSKRLKRSIGKGGSTYRIDGQTLKAFGQGVPGEVEKLLNLGPTNFQQQHDAPFWFSLTPGEVSRQLNAIIDLGEIDGVLGALAAGVRQATERQNVAEERLATAKGAKSSLNYVPVLVEAWNRVEGAGLQTRAKAIAATQARHLVGEGVRVGVAQEQARKYAGAGNLVLVKGEESKQAFERAEQLRRLVEEAERLKTARRLPVPDLGPLQAAWERAARAGDRLLVLKAIVSKVEYAGLVARETASAARTVEQNFHKQIKGKACPLCGAIQ